jgi:hypothetical protein
MKTNVMCCFFPDLQNDHVDFFSLGTVYPYRNKPWCDFYQIKLATSLIKSDTDEGLVKTFE